MLVVVGLALVPMHVMRSVSAPAMPLVLIGFTAVVYAIAQIFLARRDRLRARLHRGELPCPRCEYPLPESNDGNRTCPECGYFDREENIRLEWKWRTRTRLY